MRISPTTNTSLRQDNAKAVCEVVSDTFTIKLQTYTGQNLLIVGMDLAEFSRFMQNAHNCLVEMTRPKPKATPIQRAVIAEQSKSNMLVEEASDLQLRPGVWPGTLSHAGRTWVRGRTIPNGDEFGGYVYLCGELELHVLND